MTLLDCFATLDFGGAAEEAGSDHRRRVCRRAESPEHLQQTLLQVCSNRFLACKHICFLLKPFFFFIFVLSAVKVDFFSVSYRQLEKQVRLCKTAASLSLNSRQTLWRFVFWQVADDVNVAMERVCGTLEQESSRLTQTMGETIFELFMSLKILKGFREFLPLKFVELLRLTNRNTQSYTFYSFLQIKRFFFSFFRDAKMLALTGYNNWFKSSIHKWLQIVHDRSCDRICKAVETDKVRSKTFSCIVSWDLIYKTVQGLKHENMWRPFKKKIKKNSVHNCTCGVLLSLYIHTSSMLIWYNNNANIY